MKKALFVTYPKSLDLGSNITGGVQLCSREFYKILLTAGFDLEIHNIEYTQNIFKRIRIKYGLSSYDLVDEFKIGKDLIARINNQQIAYVFLNMAGLMRLSEPLRREFGDRVKIYLLSHGNDSGDFMHLQVNPLKRKGFIRRQIDIYRLGLYIKTESYYRKNFLDGVFAVSQTEQQIENWLGAKQSIFVGHYIDIKENEIHPVNGRIGFIGRLDHPPNYLGSVILLKAIEKLGLEHLRIRVIGAPESYGKKIEKMFKNVEYLGELSDNEVIDEINTWQFLVNPVFWFPTGYSTKLGWALGNGFPIISTSAGNRGYIFNEEMVVIANTPDHMATLIGQYINDDELYGEYLKSIKKLKCELPTIHDVAKLLKKQLME